jgi:hypothetical protein
MRTLSKEEGGWTIAYSWLMALEETARDFHGTLPRAFCQRGYEHATENWFGILEEQYGITIPKASTVKKAVENHIEMGVRAGLFRDASQFDLRQVNPHRLEIRVLECPYRRPCEQLIESGLAIRELTCARIGCFRAAAEILSEIPCKYEVTSFLPDGTCEGFIENR